MSPKRILLGLVLVGGYVAASLLASRILPDAGTLRRDAAGQDGIMRQSLDFSSNGDTQFLGIPVGPFLEALLVTERSGGPALLGSNRPAAAEVVKRLGVAESTTLGAIHRLAASMTLLQQQALLQAPMNALSTSRDLRLLAMVEYRLEQGQAHWRRVPDRPPAPSGAPASLHSVCGMAYGLLAILRDRDCWPSASQVRSWRPELQRLRESTLTMHDGCARLQLLMGERGCLQVLHVQATLGFNPNTFEADSIRGLAERLRTR